MPALVGAGLATAAGGASAAGIGGAGAAGAASGATVAGAGGAGGLGSLSSLAGPLSSLSGGGGGGGGGGTSATPTSSGFSPDKAFEQAKTVVGGVVGAGQLAAGVLKKRQAQDLALVDPGQTALLADIRAKRKSIETGAAASGAVREAEQLGATTQTNIARATGGDVQGTVAGLVKAQRATSEATTRAISASRKELPFFTNLQTDLTNRVAQRKLDIQALERAQKLGEAAQLQKQGFSNLSAAVASLDLPQGIGKGTGTPSPTPSPTDTGTTVHGTEPIREETKGLF